jgi:hypothetical protein
MSDKFSLLSTDYCVQEANDDAVIFLNSTRISNLSDDSREKFLQTMLGCVEYSERTQTKRFARASSPRAEIKTNSFPGAVPRAIELRAFGALTRACGRVIL